MIWTPEEGVVSDTNPDPRLYDEVLVCPDEEIVYEVEVYSIQLGKTAIVQGGTVFIG